MSLFTNIYPFSSQIFKLFRKLVPGRYPMKANKAETFKLLPLFNVRLSTLSVPFILTTLSFSMTEILDVFLRVFNNSAEALNDVLLWTRYTLLTIVDRYSAS